MVQVGVANCRQICHRARARLAAGGEGRARFEVAPELHQRLTERFLAACLHGDVQGLTAVLAHDVVVWSDGGGKVSAATRPVRGRDHTVRFITGLLRKGAAGLRPTVEEVNGVPGILLWRGETLVNVLSFDLAEGHIQGLRFVVNPDKLLFMESQFRRRGASTPA